MKEIDYWYLCKEWVNYIKEFSIKGIAVIEDKLSGAYCIIGKCIKNDTLIIRFKGTEFKFNDIITDLLFAKKRIPYDNMNPKIKVHTGFIIQYLTIRDRILECVRYYKNLNIVVIGHSLGAALATLCVLDLQYNFHPESLSGVVFGSPRVGNKEFVRSFNGRVRNFKNIQLKNDWITHLPLKTWGFDHVDKEIKIGKNRMYSEHNVYNKYL
jgi:triacylglycerol lipase